VGGGLSGSQQIDGEEGNKGLMTAKTNWNKISIYTYIYRERERDRDR
jgi:hypothetical protein